MNKLENKLMRRATLEGGMSQKGFYSMQFGTAKKKQVLDSGV